MQGEKHLNKTNLAAIVSHPQVGHHTNFHLLESLSLLGLITILFIYYFRNNLSQNYFRCQILSHAVGVLYKDAQDTDFPHVVYSKINEFSAICAQLLCI